MCTEPSMLQIPNNFAKVILDEGGYIAPLLIDHRFTQGTGTTNPSVLIINGNVVVNVRHVEYTLYHSETKKYTHPWGPVQYLHRENDMALRTNNFLGAFNTETKSFTYTKVDTSKLDVEPIWEFVGLEDARLVKWDDKLYLSGVRRDTTPNGQGRMELSEITWENGQWVEVNRYRIPAPNGDGSYCEKNWMPVLDMPFHYVKWCNPTEVVKVDPEKLTCETVHIGDSVLPLTHDLRGGSQVIPYGDYRLALTHQVDLFKTKLGRRDAVYKTRFIIWDQEWNVVNVSEPFDFLGGHVEFVCGAAWSPDGTGLMVTFGYQDNSAFLVNIPKTYLDNLLGVCTQSTPAKPALPPMQSKVIDYFQYFNEKELLELRIRTLEDKVDHFIISEANSTFTGTPKEFTLEETIKELGLPEEKIRIVKVNYPDNLVDFMQNIDVAYSKHEYYDPRVLFWIRERLQRDALLSVIEEYNEDDVFLITDCDEIVRPEMVNMFAYQAIANPDKLIKIPMTSIEGRADLQVFNLDDTPVQWDRGPFVCTKKHLANHTPHQLRGNFFDDLEIVHIIQDGKRIEDTGWHFSWMGGYERAVRKASAFAHAKDVFEHIKFKEYNTQEMIDFMQNYLPKEGSISPSGDRNTVLKKYDVNKLPPLLMSLPRVKNYLLPHYEELEVNPIPVLGTAVVNGVSWLKRMVGSINYPVRDLVIINNNGRGELDEELRALQNKPHLFIDKIHICTMPGNIGCAGAWNLIIKSFMNSPYWVIVNHDIMFGPGFLKEMAEKATDSEVGMVHGMPGDRGDGMYDVFLIKDWVVDKFGLFDENFYPAYVEDVEYNVRLSIDPPKRVLQMESTYVHGNDDYATSGSQTWRTDPTLKPKLYMARELNESEYMVSKWGPEWEKNPYRYPFDLPVPLTSTTFDLEFSRRKHLGF